MSGDVLLALIIVCAVAGYFAMSLVIDALRRDQPQNTVPELPTAVVDDVGWARQILGIHGYLNAAGLKKRYYELLAQYHPDKTQHLGPEIQQLAAKKTSQIIRAFGILRSRISE
jgi:hypothetical protein